LKTFEFRKACFLEMAMRNSTAREFSHPSNSALIFKSLTARDVDLSLMPFYLSLDFDGRRRRFGCAVSDESIAQHCGGLNLEKSIVLACSGNAGLLAAIELHPLAPDWEHAEMALAESAETDRTTIVAHLLQLAAFAAGKRACTALVIPSCCAERAFIELLRGMGRARMRDDLLWLELGEYASLRSAHSF
jgi:hypothetical protein